MKRLLVLLLPCLALFSGCKRESPSWDTGLVFPLAHASLSIDHILADSLISTNADGSVKLVYTTNFLGLSTDTIFHIPDTTVTNPYSIPFGQLMVAPGDQITPNTPNQMTYGISNAQLVFGTLRDGKLYLKMQNDIRRRVLVTYQVPCATLNNIPFTTTFVVPAAPDSLHSTFAYQTIDLSGYSIDFTGTNHDRTNTVTTIFNAEIDPTEPTGCYIYPADTVNAICTFSSIKPDYVRGYFGNQTIHIGPEESSLSFFRKIRSGSIGLDSLKMTLDITNYVGMDAQLTVHDIWSRNERTNNTVNLTHPFIGTTTNINRGVYSNSWPPVVPSTYHWEFNNGNSNAKALVENLPGKLGYDLTLVTNPLGNVSGNNDFLFADYGIDARLNVEMPLSFFADQLVVADTIVPDFSGIKNKENILDGKLTLFAENSFPFDADLQLYLLDAAGNVTDSLVVPSNRITAGPTVTTGNYIVTSGFTNSQLHIPLSALRTQALLNTSRIIVLATFNTNSNPVYAKIFSTNRLDLQLTADFNYRVD